MKISALATEVSELNMRIGELTEMLKASSQNAFEMARQMSGLLKQLGKKDRQIAERKRPKLTYCADRQMCLPSRCQH